ncbi:restriction endonuclease subunit S [Tessaracoccus sp. Y1736]
MSTAFGGLLKFDIGGGWGTDAADPESSSIGYVIRGTDIPRVAVGDVSTVPLRFHKASNLASRVLRSGDIVFEVSGGSKGQPVGRALQITEGVLAKFDETVMCASFCKLVRVDPAIAEPGFIFRALQAAYADGSLDTYQVQSTGITNFRWKPFLEHFQVHLPPRSDQQRIASTLDVFDDLIENNRRRVELLEEMARAIYREWFVKFRYPGHADVPMVDSALGPIPEGWETPQLADYVSTQYGYTESATKDPIGPKYLRGMDINKTSYIDWASVPFCPVDERAARKFQVDVGDIFIIRMADPGKVGMCESNVDAVFASYLVRVRPTSEALSSYFLFFTLSGDSYQAWVTGASTGATRKSVSAKVMTEPRIVLPPLAVQRRFEDAIVPMRASMMELVSANAKLAELRDLLLPKLVTGQIDVSTLDLDAWMVEQMA